MYRIYNLLNGKLKLIVSEIGFLFDVSNINGFVYYYKTAVSVELSARLDKYMMLENELFFKMPHSFLLPSRFFVVFGFTIVNYFFWQGHFISLQLFIP